MGGFSAGNLISGLGNLGSSLYGLGLIGGNSVKTDRATQLAAQQGLWNVFGFGLPQGENQQIAGQGTLNTALTTLQQPQSYWQRLLSGGRTDYQQLAAPAISAVQNQNDALARQQATLGTSRTGGATAINAESAANTQSTIDQIINQNLMQGRAAGAQGLQQISGAQAQIGGMQLENSLRLLGLSEDAVKAIMSNATLSQKFQNALRQQNAKALNDLAQQIAKAVGGSKGSPGPFTTPPFNPGQNPTIGQPPDSGNISIPGFPGGIGNGLPGTSVTSNFNPLIDGNNGSGGNPPDGSGNATPGGFWSTDPYGNPIWVANPSAGSGGAQPPDQTQIDAGTAAGPYAGNNYYDPFGGSGGDYYPPDSVSQAGGYTLNPFGF